MDIHICPSVCVLIYIILLRSKVKLAVIASVKPTFVIKLVLICLCLKSGRAANGLDLNHNA